MKDIKNLNYRYFLNSAKLISLKYILLVIAVIGILTVLLIIFMCLISAFL